jgi:hypothetical protein
VIPFFAIYCLAGAEAQKGEPRIVFEASSFDFNEVKEGTAVEYAFRFENNGNRELIIKQIKTS